MHPIICKLGPFTIYTYGLMVVLAFLAATFLTTRQGKKQGFDPEVIVNLSFVVLIFGLIGARLLYVILNIGYYLDNPWEIFMLQRGGLAWFGGLFLAFIAGITYLKKKNLAKYTTLDLLIPFVALGQSIGRIGCLLNGCCFGRVSRHFGIYFPVHNALLIPTQLYSSLLLLGIYIILRIKQIRVHKQGEIFYLYLFLYSLKRFFIEFFRSDSEIFILGLSIFQIFSIVLFIISVVMLIRIKRQPVQ